MLAIGWVRDVQLEYCHPRVPQEFPRPDGFLCGRDIQLQRHEGCPGDTLSGGHSSGLTPDAIAATQHYLYKRTP